MHLLFQKNDTNDTKNNTTRFSENEGDERPNRDKCDTARVEVLGDGMMTSSEFCAVPGHKTVM